MNGLRLDRSLLFSEQLSDDDGGQFNSLNVRGSYSTFQFVLNLSPRIHQLLSSRPTGLYTTGDIGFEHAQAFSTCLHENVHWWQHIGSTYGFIMSLTFPGQAHNNHRQLNELVRLVGFKKDIRTLSMILPRPITLTSPAGIANIIVNNHFDFAAYRAFTFDAKSADAVVSKGQFEGAGHAFKITYENTLGLLAVTADRNKTLIADAAAWQPSYDALKKINAEGFGYGQEHGIWPIGAKELFEGQASFCQMQYLAFASGNRLGWDSFRSIGMLHGVYEVAFKVFLALAELDWPPTVIHPTTALFLLVCDMAINPGIGFPLPLESHLANLHKVAHPGGRFLKMATVLKNHQGLASKIQNYSREEYAEVSEALGKAAQLDAPLRSAKVLHDWANSQTFAPLMEEYKTFDYQPLNMPIRVLFSHFLAFMRDKYEKPEYFCWPGAWMAGDRVAEEASVLFDRHGALFVNRDDKPGVFPRIRADRDEKLVQKTFDAFYASNVTYHMTDQWITKPGPFTYKFDWLAGGMEPEAIKEFADRQFFNVYNVKPDDVELVSLTGDTAD